MKRALALLALLSVGLACRAAPPPSPTPTRDPRLASAREALRQGDPLKAASFLEAFLREHPEAVEAVSCWGRPTPRPAAWVKRRPPTGRRCGGHPRIDPPAWG
jgi:hypothetical protein